MDEHIAALRRDGFAWIRGGLGDAQSALEAAHELISARCAAHGDGLPVVVGDFVLPPLDGPPTRDFQTLHFDFGVPLDPRVPKDLGRWTALHVCSGASPVTAATRLVPLRGLLSQRDWPPREELLDRLSSYGRTHGAWDDTLGYVEGSLARLVEAATGEAALPSVKTEPGFLCGMEFHNLRAEAAFFERHSVPLDGVEVEIGLRPGDLLIFDNLSHAHGRRGTRCPGELRQWVFGDRELNVARQVAAREEVVSAFDRRCVDRTVGPGAEAASVP